MVRHNALAIVPLFPDGGGMKALRIANAEAARISLQQEIGRSVESRYDHRLHGVLLVPGARNFDRLLGLKPAVDC